MIRIATTSRGLLVFTVPGGWGDWYQVALFDEGQNEIASDEDELLEERDLSLSLVSVGIPGDEACALAAQLVPGHRSPGRDDGACDVSESRKGKDNRPGQRSGMMLL